MEGHKQKKGAKAQVSKTGLQHYTVTDIKICMFSMGKCYYDENYDKDKINSINSLAAGMLSNTTNSTQRAAMEVMYDLIPIPLVIKQEAMASYIMSKESP